MQLPDGPAHKADRDYNQHGNKLTLKLVQNVITALFGLGLSHLLPYWYFMKDILELLAGLVCH